MQFFTRSENRSAVYCFLHDFQSTGAMTVVTLLWPTGSRHIRTIRAIPRQLPSISFDTQTFVIKHPYSGFAVALQAFCDVLWRAQALQGDALFIFVSDLLRPRGRWLTPRSFSTDQWLRDGRNLTGHPRIH